MPDQKTLRPIHPSAAIQAKYNKALQSLIKEMNDSVQWWIKATYRRHLSTIAQDDAADDLRKSMEDLKNQWFAKFDLLAKKLAAYFATATAERSTTTLKRYLREGGFTVKFQMTPAMQDIVDATVHQNVSLIKSIPQQYLEQVEGLVMRSVQTGRDMGYLADELQKRYGITRRRAAFIARDQNEKATAAFNRARQLEVGIENAIWVHSGGGKHPRPSHKKAGREKVVFSVADGWYDPEVGYKIQPGFLPNCRCVSRSMLPGLADHKIYTNLGQNHAPIHPPPRLRA